MRTGRQAEAGSTQAGIGVKASSSLASEALCRSRGAAASAFLRGLALPTVSVFAISARHRSNLSRGVRRDSAVIRGVEAYLLACLLVSSSHFCHETLSLCCTRISGDTAVQLCG